MLISKNMVKVLTSACRGKTSIKEISKDTGLSVYGCSRALSRLVNVNFIAKERTGMGCSISLSNASFAQEFKEMVHLSPTIRFDDFLYGINFRILSYCLHWKTSESMEKQLKISKKSIQNRLSSLANRALLNREGELVRVSRKAWPKLYSFLEQFRNFSTIKGNVLWKFEDEILFEVNKEEDIQGVLTGFNSYDKYKIKIRNIKYCCYIPEKKLGKEEIFIHSLLQIRDDSRLLNLAVVFYIKYIMNREKLKKLAMKYDCIGKLRDLASIPNAIGGNIVTKTLPETSRKELDNVLWMYK